MALVPMDYETPQSEIFASKVLKSSDNMNDITELGVYSWANNSAPTNSPQFSGSYISCACLVLRFASQGLIQVVFNDVYICFRYKSGNTWGSWRRIAGTVIS